MLEKEKDEYSEEFDFPEDVDEVENGPEMFEHFRFEVDKGQSMLRIDKYLVIQMASTSRNRIQDAADAGNILVNGKPVKSNYKVKPLDVISIVMAYPPSSFEIIPQNIPINIVYEDDHIILINKQPGLVVHPGFGNFDGTLLNAIAFHMKDHPDFDVNDARIGLVHRIDKDTSGLVLIAKTPDAKSRLGKQFFEKTTKRSYNTVVWGNVKEDEGTITGSLARDPRDRMLFKVFGEGENPLAKHAVTHYKVLERLGYVTLVECRLETGRTHQIRVHMKHIGHTIFNDERYGGHEILKGNRTAKYQQFVRNCFDICPRQALHAKTLGFVHPVSGEEMFFESELPDDMQELTEKWRNYAKQLEI